MGDSGWKLLLLSFEIFEGHFRSHCYYLYIHTIFFQNLPHMSILQLKVIEGALKRAPTSFLIKRRGTAFFLILHFSLLKFHFKPLLKYWFQSLMICVSVIKKLPPLCVESVLMSLGR